MATTLLLLAALAVVNAQKPSKPPTYQMNMSTIIMPCNNSGFTDPKSTVGCKWGSRFVAALISPSCSLLPLTLTPHLTNRGDN